MEQHPIPQQISSYEFRLVGDMTLKQFGLAAGGALIALLFYVMPLPGIFRWPLMIGAVSLGIAMAFLPLEERPLQTWIFAFFRAVYSPTQYLWQKQAQKPEIFEETTTLSVKTPPIPTGANIDQKKLDDYLTSLPGGANFLEEKEENFLSKVEALFAGHHPLFAQTPAQDLESPTPPPPPTQEIKQEVKPQTFSGPFVVEKIATPVTPGYVPPAPTAQSWRSETETQAANFAPGIPLPSIPEFPNVLVGMVLNTERKMVEGAILEIRDQQGNPVRALRTNKLGQFRIATPLPNGLYQIVTEKEGLDFDVVRIELRGEIVQPILIGEKGGVD